MLEKIEAVFDGTSLQLEKPLSLAAGTRVTVIVENILSDDHQPPKTFLQTARSLQLQGEPDWSMKVDQYLYDQNIYDND